MVDGRIQAFKLTKEEWEEIEIEGNETERKVCLCMLNLGTSKKTYTAKSIMTVLGEELYQEYLHSIILKTYCNNEKTKKPAKKDKKDGEKKGGGGKKKGKNDIYSKHIAAEKYKKFKELSAELPKWNMENLFHQKNVGFSSNILEVKLLSFLQVKQIQPDDIFNNYELIIALKKCLYYYSSYEGVIESDIAKAPVSETCIELLNEFLERLMKQVNFSVKNIFSDYPKLIFSTKFDDFFENLDIKPFASQVEIVNIFKASVYSKSSTLFFYRPVIGSGKTTVCLAMAAAILEYNKYYEKNIGLIFCCGITQVRIQLGQMIYTALRHENITFAVAAIDYTNSLRVINHFSCKNEKNPALIIADMETTSRLLTEQSRPYILFMDDPIIDADQEESPITEKFINIMQMAPSVTIISSATLPTPEDVPNLVRIFRNKNATANVVTVSSDRAKIGQQIYTEFQNKYYPHLDCVDRASLKNVIKKVKSSPFLARMYTGSSLYHLEDLFLKISKTEPTLTRIEEYFSNPTMFNQESIENFAMSILESLLNFEDEIIKEFCSSSNYPIEKDYSDISLENLTKKDACKLSGGCLIASLSPKSFARKWFGPWVEKCDFDEMIKEYQRKVKEFEEGKKRFDDIKNEIERFKELESYQSMGRIKFRFPENLKINTKSHLERYGKESLAMVCRKDEEAQNLVIKELEEDVNLMLMSGIGIFDESAIDSPEYHKTIRRKAKANQLAYLISKTDILYGANFPLNNIIIEKDFSLVFSINTIFQIMGRAGRMGTSWKSNCFIFEDLKEKLENHLKLDEKENPDSTKEARKIEKIVTEMIGLPVPVDESIEKITILFGKKKLDAVLAFLPCFWYYCLKLKKNFKSFILSDFDISEYIRIPAYEPGKPLIYIPQQDEKIIILDAEDDNIIKFIKDYNNVFKKLVIINHQETYLEELNKFEKTLDPITKEKIEIVAALNVSSAKLSFDKYVSLIKEEFGLQKIETVIPDHIRILSKKTFDLAQYAEVLKYIDDHHVSFGKTYPESKFIGSLMIETLKNDGFFVNINLQKIWNLMTFNAEKLKKEGKKRYDNIVQTLEPLLNAKFLNALTLLNENNEKVVVFLYRNLPFEHYMHISAFADLILSKYDEYKKKIKDLKKAVVFSRKKKGLIDITFRSEDKEFAANKFCERYHGGGHAYSATCELKPEQFDNWTFAPL